MCENFDPEIEDNSDNPTVIRWKEAKGEPADFKAALVEEFGEYGIHESDKEYIIEVDPDAELKQEALAEVLSNEQIQKTEAGLLMAPAEKELFMRGYRKPYQHFGDNDPFILEGVKRSEELIEIVHGEKCSAKKEKMLVKIKQLLQKLRQEQN